MFPLHYYRIGYRGTHNRSGYRFRHATVKSGSGQGKHTRPVWKEWQRAAISRTRPVSGARTDSGQGNTRSGRIKHTRPACREWQRAGIPGTRPISGARINSGQGNTRSGCKQAHATTTAISVACSFVCPLPLLRFGIISVAALLRR